MDRCLGFPFNEEILELLPAPESQEVVFNYASLGLTLRSHPMSLLRPLLAARHLKPAADLDRVETGTLVHYAGIVTLRKQPETANGTVSMSLEGETRGRSGHLFEVTARRAAERELLLSRLFLVHRTWQLESDVKSLIAGKLEDLTPTLGQLTTQSRDFN
jgi:error-prone DNA polymerase